MSIDINTLTIKEARKMGVQAFRDGKTFAAYNVRPLGFALDCILGNRLDLLAALDCGWHTANRAEPVKLESGEIIGNSDAAAELEAICHA